MKQPNLQLTQVLNFNIILESGRGQIRQKFKNTVTTLQTRVSDPDPLHLAGSGSGSGSTFIPAPDPEPDPDPPQVPFPDPDPESDPL